MKQKLTQLDLTFVTKELQLKLPGRRIQNIYSLKDGKTFLFKFYSKNEDKQFLLIEQGIRIHLSNYQYKVPSASSQMDSFCVKLRKHLKSRKLMKITQLGFDKILLLTFANVYLIIELYNNGNMILLNDKWYIIGLQRIVDSSEAVQYKVGLNYPFQSVNVFCRFTREEFESIINDKKNSGLQLKRVKFGSIPAVVVDHFLAELKSPVIYPNVKVNKILEHTEAKEILFKLLSDSQQFLFTDLLSSEKFYIFSESSEGLIQQNHPNNTIDNYVDVSPYKFNQLSSYRTKEFNSFNEALDEYFTQRNNVKQIQKEQISQAKQQIKLQSSSQNHESKLRGYLNEIDQSFRKAESIIANEGLVDDIITSVLRLIADGFDWKDIERIVQEEKMRRNKIALLIESLQLEIDCITVSLPVDEDEEDNDDDSDDDESDEVTSSNKISVQLMLSLTAFSNAQRYYDNRKQLQAKFEKMQEAVITKVPKEVKKEDKIDVNIPRVIRKQYWFEKFLWFISSENFLVLGGKDAHQNETLVKKYFKEGDIYVHADVAGSSSVIIKNKKKDDVIPINTIVQAGCMAICNSKAWDNKIVTSAYYVYHEQVSKTAPSGEYLSTGSFMIRGKKNFLPPTQLQYGTGLLFRFSGDEEAGQLSVKRHWGERRPGERDKIDSSETTDQLQQRLQRARLDSDEELKPPPKSLVVENEEAKKLAEKYNLTELGEDETFASDLPRKSETREPKKYVTKKERQGKQTKDTFKDKKPEPSEDKPKNVQLPRGKRTKMKRIKKKYAGMDEEDFKLRSQLLQSGGKVETDDIKNNEAVSESEDEEQEEEQVEILLPYGIFEEMEKLNIARKDLPANLEDFVEDDDELDEKSEEESDEGKQVSLEENTNEVDDSLEAIDFLTGCPHPEDVILHALPVCAPYSALNNYQYKLKLVPGGLKKGKAAKQVMNTFQGQKADDTIRGYVKAINENDFVQSVIGKVKIIGGSEEKKKKKVKK